METYITFEELDAHYPLTQPQIDFFHENGFIKLKQVLSPEVLAYYGKEISRKVLELNTMHLPMEERDTYQKAFLQIMNIWRESAIVRQFVFSKRLSRIAAELMDVEGVRLYHDQALYKEPGGGHTPWHADQHYWPLVSDRTCTVWIPLQATPLEMGPLSFSAKSHRFEFGRDLEISDESEDKLQKALSMQQFEYVVEPFELGEISYHAGWTFHRAGPNRSTSPREVMTIIYMDAAMRLKAPSNAYQQDDWENWCPGAQLGEVVDTPMNPVLYRKDASA
jgi:ectoine hydroxylase-related dioxygenase (phytanoyl-CoA dioxygenase family)